MNSRSFLVCVAFLGLMTYTAAAGDLPVVPVTQPVMRQVTDHADFAGRASAAQSVEVRARVTGYLVAAPFKEGSDVKTGDVLFEIDPRPYRAQYEAALSKVELSRSTLKLAQVTYKRALELGRTTPGAISQQQLDQDRAAVDEAEGRVRAAQADLEIHKINLDFTKVRAPIDGRVSRYHVTPGNLVTQDQTILTTIVSLDPMYVYFDMDEATLLRIRRAVNDGKLKDPTAASSPVAMGLIGEKGYPHAGTINFIDSQVNTTTAAIAVRATFANPRPAGGVALMMPGMAVRVRLLIGNPYQALLVPESAVIRTKGGAFVDVVNAKDVLERRPVEVGQMQPDGMQVIRTGITTDDRVVLQPSKGLKAGDTVRPKKTP